MPPVYTLPYPLRHLVDDELDRGELIRWVGQPDPSRFARQAWPIVLFGIPWTAFALFWMAGASGFQLPDPGALEPFDFFPLFGLPFVLIGFGMLSAPFWLKWKAESTVYVVTDRRAIVFEGSRSVTVRSYTPDELGDLTRKQRPDGSGDLIFEREVSYTSKGHRRVQERGFLAIQDVREVEDLVEVLAAQRKPTESSSPFV